MSNTTKNSTITVFVPAYNEEENLADAVRNAVDAVKDDFKEYEIMIVNANSSDRTGEIADSLARNNRKIRVIHNKSYFGLGENYMNAVRESRMQYFTMLPGDNENSPIYFRKALQEAGKAEIIATHTLNKRDRSVHRRILSEAYFRFLNFIFELNLKYYNGNAVYKTAILKKLKLMSGGFEYNSEILIRLIKAGYSYEEFGIKIRPTHKTSIFRIKNVVSILKTILLLFFDIRIRKNFLGE